MANMFIISGLISDIIKKESKNGKPYTTFNITSKEQFNGNTITKVMPAIIYGKTVETGMAVISGVIGSKKWENKNYINLTATKIEMMQAGIQQEIDENDFNIDDMPF